MSTLAEELKAVLPASDPLTQDRFQLITRAQYFELIGPMHQEKFWRMAATHPDGDHNKPIELNLERFVDAWWQGDVACVIRWSPTAEFVNVTAYRRTAPTVARIVMSIGETVTSNTMSLVLYDIGIRHLTQEARSKRIPIAESRGWKIVRQTRPNHYELEIPLHTRPTRRHLNHPPGMDPGRK